MGKSSKPLVILISGKQGSGKTTLRNGLIGYYPGSIGSRFSDPIYEMHHAIRDVAAWYDIPFEKKEGRLLQLLGDEWGRQVKGSDIWVNVLKDRVGMLVNHSPVNQIIVDDLRYRNEFDAFEPNNAYDVIKIRLFATEHARKHRAAGWRVTTNHASETDLDGYEQQNKFDLVIDTDILTAQTTLKAAVGFIKDCYENPGDTY